MSVEQDVVKFLTRELVKNRANPIQKISLRHSAPETKGNEVHTIDLADRVVNLTIDELPQIADEIVANAQTYADGIGGVQRFTVALYQKGEIKACIRHPFRIRGGGDEFEEAGDEGANTKGLLSQLMRHNEAMAKTMVHAVAGLTTVMARRLESSDATITRLTDQHYKHMELLEEAKSEQHSRDMELLTTEASESRKNQMFEKLALLVPVMINKLAGQKVLDAADPTALMLKSFTESMTKDQFAKIQSVLKPEQMILLAQLLQDKTETKQLPGANETS